VVLINIAFQRGEALAKVSHDMEGRIQEALNSARENIYRIYNNTSQGRLSCMIAALRLAIDTESELPQMFVGQLSLLSWLSASNFKDESADTLALIVKRTWKKRLNFPIEFPTRRLTIPAIQTACEESATGFKLAAGILLQARFAVTSVRISPETIQRLELLAR